MKEFGKTNFDFARNIAIAAVLLFAPVATSATGSNSPAPASSSHGAAGGHHVNTSPDTIERHGAPAEEPPHCHLRSLHPQKTGPVQAAVKDDLPLPTSQGISAPARETGTHLPDAWAGAPIPAPPRFILFGNFRS